MWYRALTNPNYLGLLGLVAQIEMDTPMVEVNFPEREKFEATTPTESFGIVDLEHKEGLDILATTIISQEKHSEVCSTFSSGGGIGFPTMLPLIDSGNAEIIDELKSGKLKTTDVQTIIQNAENQQSVKCPRRRSSGGSMVMNRRKRPKDHKQHFAEIGLPFAPKGP